MHTFTPKPIEYMGKILNALLENIHCNCKIQMLNYSYRTKLVIRKINEIVKHYCTMGYSSELFGKKKLEAYPSGSTWKQIC